MNIPCKINPLGVYRLPAGYLPALFLESTGTQYIDTKYIPNNETGLLIDQEKLITGDTMPMGCRNSQATATRFFVSRSLIFNKTDGQSGFGWGQWKLLSNDFTGRQIGKLNRKNNRVAEIGTFTRSLESLGFEPTQSIYIFAANVGGQASLVWGGRVYVAQISQGAETAHNYIPAISPAGAPCMYDKVTKNPFYNEGRGSFIVGMTVAQARKLWQLPADAENKTLTISLPQSAFVDLETGEIADADVNAALAYAETKGWTITIQTYTES